MGAAIGFGVGVGRGVSDDLGLGVADGLGAGAGVGMDAAVAEGSGDGVGVGTGAAVGVGTGVGLGVGTGAVVDIGRAVQPAAASEKSAKDDADARPTRILPGSGVVRSLPGRRRGPPTAILHLLHPPHEQDSARRSVPNQEDKGSIDRYSYRLGFRGFRLHHHRRGRSRLGAFFVH